jgi:hypothetical protein
MGKYSDRLGLTVGGPEAAQALRPAPLSDSSRAAGYGATVAGSYVDDPMARARLFAERRGIPLSRYRIVEGRPVYRGDDGKEYFEEPDFSPLSDPGSTLTSIAGMAGPVTAAGPPTAVGIMTAPLSAAGPGGLAAGMTASGAAGAGGQYVKEAIGDWVTGEDQPGTELRMSKAFGENFLTHGLGTGLNMLMGRNVARDVGRLNPAQATGLQRKATAEGIPLTPAEITNMESLKATQRILTNMPASAAIMRDFYEGRAANIDGRIAGMLDSVSTQDSGEVAGRATKEWALMALEMAKNERATAAEPFYTAARASGVQVDARPVVGLIDRELQTAKGPARKALEAARSYFFDQKGEVDTSIAGLHSAKLALDDLIGGFDQSAATVGPAGQKSSSFRSLSGIKDGLVKILTNASGDYKTGMETFERMSDPLNKMQNSLIGILANVEDKGAQKAMLGMFNPATSGERAVYTARGVFGKLGPQGKEAWQAAKRIMLQDTWDKAAKEFATTNQAPSSLAGGKFRAALFGDKRQTAILKAAFEPQEFQALSSLADVLEATGRVRLSGSETAWNSEMIANAKDNARPMLMRLARNINPAQALRSFDETVTNYFHQNKLEELAKVYTSPNAMLRLKELKILKPGTQRWVVGLMQLAGELGDGFVSQMLATSADAVPPHPGQAEPPGAPQAGAPPATPRRSYSERLGLTP